MISYRSIATLCGAVMLAACGEDAVQQISAPATGANVRFFNFAIATPPTTSAPGINFFANDQKVTAISSTTGTESTTGTVTGGAASGGLYSQVAAGSYTLRAVNGTAASSPLTLYAKNTVTVSRCRWAARSRTRGRGRSSLCPAPYTTSRSGPAGRQRT